MKKMKGVPAADTSAIPGDYKGTRSMVPTQAARSPQGMARSHPSTSLAPKPSGGAKMFGHDRPTAPVNHPARVRSAGGAPSAGSFLPVQNNAMANISGQQTGQNEVAPRGPGISMSALNQQPVTRNAVATTKPKRKGLGAAFFGEY